MVLLVTLLLASGPARAEDAVHEAERVRLSQDIKQLAQREAWTGVERKFEELEVLGITMSFDDLYRGACAARALGDVQAAYDRLKAAAELDPRRDVLDWLYAIDNHYGQVELLAVPPRNSTLDASEMPFDPADRAAVMAASARVAREGTFTGLLPRGSYTFAGHVFTVEPGVSQNIQVNTRRRRAEPEPPPLAPGSNPPGTPPSTQESP